jgi:hypothetical protein
MEVLEQAYETSTLNPPIRIIQRPEPPKANVDTTCANTSDANLTLHPLTESLPGVMKATARLLQRVWPKTSHNVPQVRVNIDGGANRSLTNDRSHLISFRNIKRYPMAGVAVDINALVCTGVGYLPWQADDGTMVLVKCYYSPNAAEAIISPTDVIVNNASDFTAWSQYSNIDTGQGYIEFHCRNSYKKIIFTLSSQNGLWYHTNNHDTVDYDTWICKADQGKPVVHRISKAAEYQLAYLRWGCAGERVLSGIHHHVDEQPKLTKHSFFKCLTCLLASGTHRDSACIDDSSANQVYDDWINEEPLPTDSVPGQHFQVDFGFMKGSGY